ncbi:MAG: triple tyrosine motif-containing protein [Bacteroidetes bacterium]|nr:triple tyrosine motif-containing protein [Bacteroidota bacterium]
MNKIYSAIIKLLLIVTLFFGVIIPSYSQELKFSRITSEQGLSMGVVNCILQDSRGFMWFGTQDGLNKFDGYNITVFKNNQLDSNSLSNNFINALYETKNGELLIGTNGGGFDSYNLVTGKFKHHIGVSGNKNTLSNNNVKSILEDKEGLLWIGTDDVLNSYNQKTKKYTRYLNDKNNVNSLSNNNAWSLDEGPDGKIWIGTYGGGLNSFDKRTNKFEHFNQYDSKGALLFESINLIRCIHEDKEGLFWIGTYEGIQIFDPQSGKFIKNIRSNSADPNSLVNNQIMNIDEDASGILWIATYGSGINLYNKKTGRFRNIVYDEKNISGITSNQIKCIYHDKVGSVWIGTEGGGVNAHFHASSKFKLYNSNSDASKSFKSNLVLALMEDHNGLLWVGTSHGGLTTLDRETNTFQFYPQLSTGSTESILSLCEDKDGIIWVGTWGAGLNSYDTKTKKVTIYPEFKSIAAATIVSIFQDSRGNIWVGTYGAGVFLYNKTTEHFTNYNTGNGLSNNNVYSIYEDSKKNLWIATDGGGVVKYDPESNVFRVYNRDEVANSISSNSVNCSFEDHNGNMWFGTSNGLNKLDLKSGKFSAYFEKDGLPNDFIYCILPDKKGNFWMTTNKGISKFNPEIKNENGSAFRNYDLNDGLQGLEFNQGAYFQSKSGEIFVGGVSGFNTFFPEKIQDNPNIPQVHIISFKRFGNEVQMDTLIYDKKYIELSYKQNFFSFDFAALDYQMPGKNKYSYMLEGVDENWSPPSTQRYASYTELGGGDYVLRVRGANNDGTWNNEGVTLHIRINPPFWKTKWFYALCIFLIIGGFWAFVKHRTSSIKRENKILEDKVEERTQELAQKNKDITSSIQYAKRIQLAILPPLEQVFKYFPSSFILYKPKDIVSGDFYWFGVKNGKKIIAAVDCTGHGVPGAFMSMIGHNLLNQIISENGITEADEILNALHRGVQAALKQGTNVVDTSDGMDVAICCIDSENTELQYAGAYRPLYKVNKGKLEKIEADKNPIGGSQLDAGRKFTAHTVKIQKGDSVYMASDGFADQFGGEKGKKFMVKRFNELILSMQYLSMDNQGKSLDETFEKWRGSYQQIDDILVIGIRF